MKPVVSHLVVGCTCVGGLAKGECMLLNCDRCGHAPEAHDLLRWPAVPLHSGIQLGRCEVDDCKCSNELVGTAHTSPKIHPG